MKDRRPRQRRARESGRVLTEHVRNLEETVARLRRQLAEGTLRQVSDLEDLEDDALSEEEDPA